MAAPPSQISGEFAGRYTVERELGRGATAIVYLARDLDYGRAVAIKVLRTELAESITAERFLREIKLTAQLHHPHIVPVLGSGEDQGRLYFVLPFMDGGTLRDRLERDKQLPIPDVIEIGKTVLSALALAHEKSLIHRDVKPENILFTGGQACLSDFGIARAMERAGGESTTSTGLVRGTPAYMSPEQASGQRDYDGRSDLYSLACVLYEALAGVPAFVGATPQAVVAQRITHEPRGVRVFRPTVSPELEAVLAKALATAAADRYQTAEEFASALLGVASSTGQATKLRMNHRRIMVGALAAVVIGSLAIAADRRGLVSLFALDQNLDTTRIAILPFEGLALADNTRPEDLLFEGLRRWRGLRPVEAFEMGDALRRRTAPKSLDDAGAFSRELGAGRFVRGQVLNVGGSRTIIAGLFDSRTRRPLHEVRMTVAADSASSFAVYRRLGDSLVLRSRSPATALDTATGSVSLPAIQVMIHAHDALRAWNLPVAESLYLRALEFDPASARAALWAAQLRLWQMQPRTRYADLAHRAVLDSTALSGDDRTLAPALAALSAGDYPRACSLYRGMTVSSPSQFAGWYGLARCLDLDRVVVAAPRSPTKWRFRSNYNSAVVAYTRAFDLLPSVYQSYQGAAFSRLRALLFTSLRNLRPGTFEGPPRQFFLAPPELVGDSLVFWPRPATDVQAGQFSEDVRRSVAAVNKNREVFRRIAAGWAEAFPQSAGAKEALSVSLEIQGDAASIDSVRAALKLSSDPTQRLRLATALVWLDVKFGIPSDTAKLVEARRIADSVLAKTPISFASADYLGRLASLLGRCGAADTLIRSVPQTIPIPVAIPPTALADVNARTLRTSMGCDLPLDLQSTDGLAARAISPLPLPMQSAALGYLFVRLARNSSVYDRAWLERLAPHDFLLSARAELLRGQPDSARGRMRAIEATRARTLPGDFTPDAALPEARLWLDLRDTSKARATLSQSLANARYFHPMDAEESLDNLVMAASLVQAMALRSDIAATPTERSQWARAVAILWDRADRDVQPLVTRMRVVGK